MTDIQGLARIAFVCHEANRAICVAYGDESQVAWEDASGEIQRSAVAGVIQILDNPGISPEELHDAWCSFKQLNGWVYGPVKDANAHTHPCLVPYDQLPVEQRVKDHVFRAIVGALATK